MSEEQEEELDPRIQIELERLNTCTDSINTLETELDELNGIFRAKLAEGIQKLTQLHDKLGKCISKAAPYYIAREIARKAQVEAQRAAVQYQRSVTAHQAAKETIQLAEERFLSKHDEWEFDAAWQEMLNHATMKVMEAETNKTKSELEHQEKAASFAVAKEKLFGFEKQLKSSISKSRSYFELKEIFHKELEDLKARIYKIHQNIVIAKQDYSESLHNLEVISEQIHMRRRLLEPREPGVGAENDLGLPDIMLDDMDKNLRELNLKDNDTAEEVDEFSQDQTGGACCSSELAPDEPVNEPAFVSVAANKGCTSDLPLVLSVAALKEMDIPDL